MPFYHSISGDVKPSCMIIQRAKEALNGPLNFHIFFQIADGTEVRLVSPSCRMEALLLSFHLGISRPSGGWVRT